MSPTRIHCAKLIYSKPGEISKCIMINYVGQSQLESALVSFSQRNSSSEYLDIINYVDKTNSNGENYYQSYCINQNIYYLRPSTYNCGGKGDVTNPYYCELFDQPTNPDQYLSTAIYWMDKGIGCYECLQAEGMYSNAQLRLYSQFGIWAVDCIPQTDTETCGPSPTPQQPTPGAVKITPQPGCTITQFNQTVGGKSTCVECNNVYEDCASCDQNGCLICMLDFYWMNNSTYQYISQVPGKKAPYRDNNCIVDTCTQGYCQNLDIGNCILQDQSTLQNCMKCTFSQGIQTCQLCKQSYAISTDQKTCNQIPETTIQLTYFVNSTTNLLQKSYAAAPKTPPPGSPPGPTQAPVLPTPPSCSPTVGSDNTIIDPEKITIAAPFLLYALQRVMEYGTQNIMVNATIYLSKGSHFFFSCSGTELKNIYTPKSGSSLFQYCIEWELYRYLYDDNDNFNITIQALECSMKDYLGINQEDDAVAAESFDNLCVNLATDPKPVVFVNNAYTYFNVTGSLRVKNLRFSGINALAKAINQTNFDPSVFPQLYCHAQFEPQGVLTSSSPFAAYNTTCIQNLTGFSFTCVDPQQSIIQAPPLITQSKTCQANKKAQFSKTQASTLTCQGEITSSSFFTSQTTPIDSTDITGQLYNVRRQTLFNIYSFGAHTTTRNATPELHIENCDFEYFLAAGYESLINVETNSLSKVETFNNDYYVYNSADRGAKISIVNSTFKTSRFCKGMIVYRPSPYDGVSQYLLNYTNLYMTNPFKNKTDAYIILRNSTFFNMNSFTQVKSLALTGQSQLTTSSDNSYIINVPLFYHKGIILNIEDFGGVIEVVGCTFQKNSHYIPGILYTGTSNADQSLQMFTDSFVTKELQLTICDLTSQTDTYFFGGSFTMSQANNPDLDSFFDLYERLGLIYISRNQAAVIIKDSAFTNNIGGTFGGAITINSPDWQNGKQPHVIIQNNQFQQNMAYFSGNSVYIRNTMLSTNITQVQNCGGINIINNYFLNNIGMKIHNGGAISAYCYYIDYIYHQDYFATSNYTAKTQQISSIPQQTGSTMITLTSKADGQNIIIQKFKLNVQGNYFNENFSGNKGSAVYIRQMSSVRINTCSFINNGPVYVVAEYQYSPYTKGFAGRAITFYDSGCVDEFLYLQQCYNNVTVSSSGGVQWSQVQGAVHVIFCETAICLNSNTTQQLEISNSQFIKNFAGPVIDSSITDTASQIFIRGGMSVFITQCEFLSNAGSAYTFSTQQLSSLTNYFPPHYLDYSMSPLINIMMTPAPQVKFPIQMNFMIDQSRFYKNRNIQVVALSSTLQYFGSLIQMKNLALTTPQNKQTLNLTVQDCDFQENQFSGDSSSLIYTYEILTSVIRSKFSNNGRITEDIYIKNRDNFKSFVQSTQFDFMSYQFNDRQQFGCIMLSGSQAFLSPLIHQFVNNTFKYNFASKGVAYTLVGMDNQEIYIAGNSYSYMFAGDQGSLLYLSSNLASATILMEREAGQFLFGTSNGAITLQTAPQISFMLSNSSYSNVYANQGQVLSFFGVGKTLIQYVNFTQPPLNNSNMSTQVLRSFTQITLPLIGNFISQEILDSLVTNLIWLSGYLDLEDLSNSAKKPLQFKGIVYQNSSSRYIEYGEILNCNFLNNNVSQYAAIYSYNSQLRIANTNNKYLVANNSVYNQGVIGIEAGVNSIIENVTFINNSATNSASALYIWSQSKVSLFNTNFINSKALKSGTVLIQGDSNVNFTNCTFKGNYAGDSSTVFIQSNPDAIVSFNGSTFINNTANTNLINLLYSNANFYNTIFLDNIAQSVNHGITLINSNAILRNVTVNYTIKAFIKKNTFAVDTGFFNLNYQSTLTVNNSIISNCRGAIAAVFYVTGQSSLGLYNGTTISNSISIVGNALAASMAKVIIVDRSVFIMNGANDIQVSLTPLIVTNSRFTSTIQTSVYVISSNVTLINNTFEDGLFTFSVQQGKALFCQCKDQTTIINNTFRQLSAIQGGALYLDTSARSPGQSYLISGNNFQENQAQQGGAIYMNDAVTVNLTGNIFNGNTATIVDSTSKGQGGAFYYSCSILPTPPNIKSIPSVQCIVNIKGSNLFSNNFAKDDGGAIMWNRQRPLFLDNTTKYINNSAFYGNDIASFPGKINLVFLSNGDYVNPYNVTAPNTSLRMLQEVSGVPPLVSGNSINFNIYILDQDGNIYRTDSSSKAVIDSQNSSDSSIIVLNNAVIANEGVYYFQQVKLTTQPGTDPKLSFTFSGITSYGNPVGFIDAPVNFTPSVRKCVAGESLTEGNECIMCAPGTFQYFLPNSTTPCQTCPENAQCYGQTSVAPLAGYWRSSNTSNNFIACPNTEACLGGNLDYPNGECLTGYQGIVCGDCAPNYSSTKQFTCGGCPDPTRNLIQTVGILVAAVIVVSFLVRSTLNSANKQKPVHAVYLKILTNHIQILGAISNINYSWPEQIQKFENQKETVTSASGQVFSFDCFLMGPNNKDLFIPVFFENSQCSVCCPSS